MPEDIQIVAPSTPISQAIDTFNQNDQKNKGKAVIAQFNKNEIDQIFESFFSPRRWNRQVGLGNELSTFPNWTHVKDKDGYAIWKIPVSDYSHHAQNNVYFDDIQIENRGESTSELSTSFSKVFELDDTTFTDVTAESDSEFGEPFPILRDSTDDILYIGSDTPFSGLDFSFETLGLNVNLIIEYSQGGDSWTTPQGLVDETVNFSRSGRLKFALPGDFAQDTINGETKYWLRIKSSIDPTIIPQVYFIRPMTSVESVLSLNADQILLRQFAWVYFDNHVYVTIPNTGSTQAEGLTYIKSSSSQQNKENFFVSNHQYKSDYESYSYAIAAGAFVTSIDYLPQLSGNDDLDINIKRGRSEIANVYYEHPNSTLTLPANEANIYVFVDENGVITSNTTGFPIVCYPIGEATTDTTKITDLSDRRVFINPKRDPLYVNQIGESTKRIPKIFAEEVDVVTYKTGETVALNDNIWVVNEDKDTGIPTEDMGFLMKRGDETNAEFLFKEADDRFDFNFPINVQGNIFHDGNVIPSQNTFTLGTPTNRFGALYLNSEINFVNSLNFQSGGMNYFTMTPDGKMGFSKSTPSSKLHIFDASDSATILESSGHSLRIAASTTSGNYIQSGVSLSSGSSAPLYFTNMLGANTWVSILADGKVGIGTTSPTNTLSVVGSGEFSVSTITPQIIPASLGTSLNIYTVSGSSPTGGITIASGNLSGNGGTTGTVLIRAGTSSTSDGGYLSLGGYPNFNRGGSVLLRGGNSWADSGSVTIHGGNAGSGKGGDVVIQGGNGGAGLGGPGNITINTGSGGSQNSGTILFKVNNTEFMRMHYDGKIGIGTMVPSEKVTIQDGNLLIQGNGGTHRIRLSNNGGVAQLESLDSGVDLAFETQAIERMRIKAGGFVGLGTSSPDHLLHIFSNSDPTLKIGDNADTGGKSSIILAAGNSTVNNAFEIEYKKDLATDRLDFIDGSGSPRVTLKNGGFFGIGITDPGSILHIKNSSSVLKLESDTGNDVEYSWVINSDTKWTLRTYASGERFGFLDTSFQERLSILQDGRVGIGTSIPQKSLHVAVSQGAMPTLFSGTVAVFQRNGLGSEASEISIIGGEGTAWSAVNFGDKDDEDIGKILYNHTSNFMQIFTNASEAIRINNTQYVGIGGVDPQYQLHLKNFSENTTLNISAGQNATTHKNPTLRFHAERDNVRFYIQLNSQTQNLEFADDNGTTLHTFKQNGYVGIDVANPTEKLSVAGNILLSSGNILSSNTASQGGIIKLTGNQIAIEQTSSGQSSRLFADYAPFHSFGIYHDNVDDVFHFTRKDGTGFETWLEPGPGGTTTTTSVMQIHLGSGSTYVYGNLGVGTVSPQGKFDLVGSSSTYITQFITNTNTTGRALFTMTETTSGGSTPFFIERYGSNSAEPNRVTFGNLGKFVFTTGGNTRRLQISDNGKVSIGDISPEANLDLAGDSLTGVAAQVLQIRTGLGVGKRAGYSISTSTGGVLGGMTAEVVTDGMYPNSVGKLDIWVQNLNNTIKAISIDENAKVGIGRSNPSYALDLQNSDPRIVIRQAAINSGFSWLMFGDNFNSDNGIIRVDHSTNDMSFGTQGSQIKMTLKNDGKLGIGTTTPSYTLDVSGSGAGINISGSNARFYLEGNRVLEDASGRLDIGESYSDIWLRASTSVLLGASATPNTKRKINLTTVNESAYFRFETYSGTASNTPFLEFVKSAGTTPGTLVQTTNGDFLGRIDFKGVNSSNDDEHGAVFKVIQNGTSGTKVPSDLIINTFNSSSENTNQFVLHHSGKIGIGTGNPQDTIHIFHPTGNAQILLERNSGAKLLLASQATKGQIGSLTNHDIQFVTNGNARVTVNTSGRVGIGTTNPLNPLHIKSDTQPQLRLDTNGVLNSEMRFSVAGSDKYRIGLTNGTNELRFYDEVGLQTTLVINTTGDIGIGTINQDSKLQVVGEPDANSRSITADVRKGATGRSGSFIIKSSLDATNATFDTYRITHFGAQTYGGTNYFSIQRATSQTNGIADNWESDININGSGNVGIGTTTPAAKLEVSAATGTILKLDSGEPSGASVGMIHLERSGSLIVSHLLDANDDYSIWVSGNRKLTITGSGNVGIGTTTPASKLDIKGTTNTLFRLGRSNTATTNEATQQHFMHNFGGTEEIGALLESIVIDPNFLSRKADLAIRTQNLGISERLRIKYDGKVGIGTPNPTHLLHLKGGSPKLKIESNTSSEYSQLQFTRPDGSWVIGSESGTTRRFIIWDSVSGGQVTVYNNGNVGIGTSTPAAKLHVLGDIQVGGTSDIVYTNNLNIWSSSSDMAINYSAASLRFNSDLHESMRLTRDGKLVIGSTGPLGSSGWQLQVNTGSGEQSILVAGSEVSTTTNAAIYLSSGNLGISTVYMGDNNNLSSGRIDYHNGANYMRFFTNANERLRIDGSGYVGIGTQTPNERLTVEGSVSLDELSSSPGTTSGYGKVYAKTDGNLYFKNGSGTETNLIAAASGGLWIPNGSNIYYSAGQVGIGTSNTQALLHVSTESTGEEIYITRYQSVGSGANIKFIHARGTEASPQVLQLNDEAAYLHFYAYSRNAADTANENVCVGRIISTIDSIDAQNRVGGAIAFRTAPLANGTDVEHMRLTSGGTLAVGTTNPDTNYRCHIYSPGLFVDATSGSQGLYVYRHNTDLFNRVIFDSTRQYSDWGTSPIIFRQGGTERLRIGPSGNIGLNLTNPENKLHLPWSERIVCGEPSYSGYSGGATMWGTNNGPGGWPGFFGRNLWSDGTSFFQASSNGNQNWGTSSGIYCTGEDPLFRVITIPASANGLDYNLGTTLDSYTRLVVTSSGNVGIGTSSPSTPLHVNGSIRAGTHPGSSPKAALELVSGGSGNYNRPVIALRQITSEADTRIFADFGQHVGWGIYHRNSDNTIHFTNGVGIGFDTWSEPAPDGSTDAVGSVFRINLGTGQTAIDGRLTIGDFHSLPSQLVYVRDDFGGSGPGTLVRFQNDHSAASHGVVLDLFHTNILDSDYGENSAIIRGGEGGNTKFYVTNRGSGYFDSAVKIGNMQAQREQVVTGLDISSTGAGWYRVAKISNSNGRGQSTVTVNTTGGSYDPRSITIRWWHNWSTIGALSTISEYGNGYWSDARVTDDGGTNSYLEVYFTTALNYYNVSLQYEGGQVNGEVIPSPQVGGGTVRATTKLGKFSIGQGHFFVSSGSYIGIGTDTPETHVHIYDSSGISQGALRVHAGGGEATLGLGTGSSSWSSARKAFVAFEGWSLPSYHLGLGSASFPTINIDTLNGRVGIGLGTTSPASTLHVSGDIRTDAKFRGNLSVDDTRYDNDPPTSYNHEVSFDFKDRSTIGSPGSGAYVGLMTFAPWGDNSGDAHHQLSFNEGGLFWRQGQPDSSSWGGWKQIVTDQMSSTFSTLGKLNVGTTSQASNMGPEYGGITIQYDSYITGSTGFLAVRNPDVNHSVTSISDSNVFLFMEEWNMDWGGVGMWGLAESSISALNLAGVNSSPNTSVSSGATGVVQILGYKRSGSGLGALGVNDNILVVKSWGGNARQIFKGDGDIYTDTGALYSYDKEDDIKLVETARKIFDGKDVIQKYKDRLEDLGILKNGFMSNNKMHSLNLGALGQIFNIIKGLAEKLGVTEEELLKMAKNYA